MVTGNKRIEWPQALGKALDEYGIPMLGAERCCRQSPENITDAYFAGAEIITNSLQFSNEDCQFRLVTYGGKIC
jgi:hypothetical protein